MFMDFNPGAYGRRKPKLKDQSKIWKLMLSNISNRPKPRILSIGMTGSGKTAEKFILCEMLLKFNSLNRPKFVWWKAPPDWINKLEKYLPAYHRGKHVSAKDIMEVDKYTNEYSVVLLMDEADREMGANSALEKGAVRFGRSMTLFRQKNIFFHGGSQIGKVNKTMRQQVDIIIYRGNTPRFVNESDDSFAQDYAAKIKNLMVPENKKYCYFTSSYSYLLTDPENAKGKLVDKGRLTLDLFEWCPYWNDPTDQFDDEGKILTKGVILSNGYQDACLDADFDTFKSKDEAIVEIADLFEKDFSNAKTAKSSEIRGWLKRVYIEKYYEIERHIPDLVDELNYRFMIKKMKAKEQESINEENNHIETSFKPNEDFPSFCKRNLKKSNKNLSELSYLWGIGLSYRQIYPDARKLGLSDYQVNTILKKWASTGTKEDYTIRAGYFFERWFAPILGKDAIIADPETHDPDILYRGIAFSCKCYSESKKSITFNQSECFAPELKYAQKNNCKYYAVGYFPNWGKITGNFIRIIEVDPIGPDQVKFTRDDKTQFLTDEFLKQLKEIPEFNGVGAIA